MAWSEPDPARDSPPAGRRRPPAWLVYLIGGALVALIVMVIGSGPVWNILWEVVPISAVVAVAEGVRRNRPERALPWLLIMAGVGFWLSAELGWTVWYAVTGDEPPDVSVLDILYLAAYVPLALGLALMPRRAVRRDVSSFLDAMVVTCALGLMAWALVMGPLFDEAGNRTVDLAVFLAYPICDLVVLFFAVRLVFLNTNRNVARLLLCGAFGALLVADALMLLDLGKGEGSAGGVVANLGWLTWAVLTGTAALHPSMARRDRTEELPSRQGLGWAKVAMFFVFIVVSTIPQLNNVRMGKVGDGGLRDVVVPFALIMGVVVSILSRLAITARLAEQRARDLDRQAESLAEALREEEMLKRRLDHRALHDPLTGLANRALFRDRLEQTLDRLGPAPERRGGTGRGALLLVDLDGFKDVNDTHGHVVGDALLAALARRLRQSLRDADTVARLGADEFAALLEETTLEEAVRAADQVMAAAREPFQLDGRRVLVTASVGLLMVEAPATAAEVLRDADLALNAAKGGGKNRLSLFDPGLRETRLDHARMIGALREALGRGEFSLNYQPVVDIATGRVKGAEALLRWRRPDGTQVSPAEFIPLAEEAGLIIEIGEWVLRQACADARRWRDLFGTYVTVNISALQLQRADFVETVLAALDESGLPGKALVLELTETALLARTKEETLTLTDRLDRLRDKGLRIALDDFGTGYSSLAYLRSLPIDIVKIDQSFMQSDDDVVRQAQAFTHAILDLCRILRLRTVAEGVETPAQHDFLRDLGCDLGQGYLYGRPMPSEDLERLLATAADRSPRPGGPDSPIGMDAPAGAA